MDLRDPLVIFANETVQNLGVNATCVFIDVTHDPKIIGDDITIWCNLQIALVHVRMKIAVAQSMTQKQL